MPENLSITLIQSDLHWEDKAKNLQMFSEKIKALDEATDLIILPEMFSTGFTMKSQLFAEEPEGETFVWMREKAAEKNCVVTGSYIVREDHALYNRLVWMLPDGNFHTYDKRHLFRMAGEHEHFAPGNKRLIVTLKGWKIMPLICYDLRFPVWSRNRGDYDMLLYVASWPEKRNHAWQSLLVARAIENICYVAGVNRVGADGNEIQYSGDSTIIDARGFPIAATRPMEEETITVVLSWEDLRSFRKSFPAFLDADEFEIKTGE
jgi:omega-amidase